MDVGALLRRARDRAQLSQAQLARAAGCDRGVLSGYETGRSSPSVRALDRLLAACGLQARVLLEPLMVGLDRRVGALDEPVPELDAAAWARLAISLDDRENSSTASPLRRVVRQGPVAWAVDGASALVLHQLATPPDALDVVAVLDEGLRFWMRAVGLMGRDDQDRPVQNWLDADHELIVEALSGVRFSQAGFVRLRVVTEPPATVSLVVPWSEVPVLVATVDEVERTSPVYGELLARWRERRNLER
jgi:transcriptional regulator with XRE-family HTH domain